MTGRHRAIVVGVAIVSAIAATCALGLWQLRRAAGKELLQLQIDAAARAAPIAPDAVALRQPEALVHRHVELDGRWLRDRVVYLDNRPHDGQPGFYVLMALHPDRAGADDVVVNRGWIPRDANDRARIAPYRTPDGDVRVTGVVLDDEPRLLELAKPGDRPLGGIWQNFDSEAFGRASGRPVVRMVVRQDREAGDADGLARDWPDRGGALQSQIDRHHGYAFQWFALAAALAAFLFYRVVRIRRHGRAVPV